MIHKSPLSCRHLLERGAFGLVILGLLGVSGLSVADVATHITPSGLETVVTPNENSYHITEGTRAGSNLFHSLGRFSIGHSDIANFQNSPGNPLTSNILARVTGGFKSTIDGTIRTTDFGAANLFLLNPAGIVFNSGATLDVGGSFHSSTADYVDLRDGGRFYSDPTQRSTLASAPPSAFGFTQTNNGKIKFAGAQLKVAPGESLTATTHRISRANLTMTSGVLSAPGGQVELTEVASGSAVTINSNNSSSSSSRSNPLVTPQNFDPSTDIYIRSGVFKAYGTSLVASPQTLGDGGNITIEAENIEIKNGTRLATSNNAIGNSGNINLIAGNSLHIATHNNADPALTTTQVNSTTINFDELAGNVNSGKITLQAPSVVVENAQVLTSAVAILSQGISGDIDTHTQDVKINKGAIISPQSVLNSAGANINVPANSVSIASGNQNSVAGSLATDSTGMQNPGDISINANTLKLGGTVSTASSRFGRENAGDILINANQITVDNQGNINSTAAGSGNAGNISIENAGTFNLRGIVSTNTQGAGRAGQISIQNLGSVNVSHAGAIRSSTTGSGNGGNISISAQSISVTDQDSGIFADSKQSPSSLVAGIGNAGHIYLTTPALDVSNGAKISTSTQTNGNAGNLTINADNLLLDNNGVIESTTGNIGSNGQSVVGAGNAGNININAINLTVQNGSHINDVTHGKGRGGQIDISTSELELLNSSSIAADSTGSKMNLSANPSAGLSGNIAIQATRFFRLSSGSSVSVKTQQANAGSIDLRVGNLLHLIASTIDTSVANGTGNGGNINIDPNFVVLANGSSIIADALQGGNILIVADFLFSSFSPDSVISASSEQGIDGTVVIRSPDVELTSNPLQLTASFLDASNIRSKRCAAGSGKTGSFILRDRVGIPPNPDTVLPSSYHDIDVELSLDHPIFRSSYSNWLLSQDGYGIEVNHATGCMPRA